MRTFPAEIVLAVVFGGGILIGLIAVIGGFLHSRRRQQMAHLERMKALELGREVPDEIGVARDKADHPEEKSHAGRCFAATGHACFWGFLFAIGAASKEGGNAPGAAYAIAAAAGAIGVTGLICGTILAARTSASAEAPIKARYDHDGL